MASQLEAPSGPEFGTVVLFTNVILGTSDYRCVCVYRVLQRCQLSSCLDSFDLKASAEALRVERCSVTFRSPDQSADLGRQPEVPARRRRRIRVDAAYYSRDRLPYSAKTSS